MSKRKNGKLYAVDISLQHAFRKEDCNGEMVISCKIGTKHIEVQRKQFNTCPVNGMHVYCVFTSQAILLFKVEEAFVPFNYHVFSESYKIKRRMLSYKTSVKSLQQIWLTHVHL